VVTLEGSPLVDLSDTEQAALDDLVFQVAPPEAPRVVVPYVARYLRREVEETLRTSVWTAFIDVEGDTAYGRHHHRGRAR
jgi:hypothetical protein